jgi:NAD(P) transhydrogenase subunit alpha
MELIVESGAGTRAGYPDDEYAARGARIVAEREHALAADAVVFVRGLGANPDECLPDLPSVRAGQAWLGLMDPLGSPDLVREFAGRGGLLFSLEMMPRISRAQSMDALSSMATVAGYKAVLTAANLLPRMFPLLMTAAGTVSPAKVLVIGAGVAGLSAIAAAKRLGAVVSAYDVRPTVKEQVESVGGKFLQLELDSRGTEGTGGYAAAQDEAFLIRQRQLLASVVPSQDVVITTAAVPGARAPLILTAEMVNRMTPGSVVVDLAADRGGNCELTCPGDSIESSGVTVLGPLNLPSEVPFHSSQLYSKNLSTFLLHLVKNGQWALDLDDEITRDTLLTKDGLVLHPRIQEVTAAA